MKYLLNKLFLRSNNLDSVSKDLENLTLKTPASKIFHAINSHSEVSEIRYVGGCVRKIINKEKIDDIVNDHVIPDTVYAMYWSRHG